jgi:excisionase family DNA binding protein
MPSPIIVIADDIPEVQAIIARLQGERAELEQPTADVGDAWMTTKQAAEYLGMTPNGLHKLTAARSIPFAQPGGFGGKCYFKRADLDAWRRS